MDVLAGSGMARPRLSGYLTSTLITLALLPGCGSCGGDEVTRAEGERLWGRVRVAAETAQRARDPIDARQLATNPETAARVLTMPIEEIIARIGFLKYQGKAGFVLERNGHRVEVFEDTLIEHGLNGGWRVLQRDDKGVILREKIHSNGLYYVRNGPGKLRLQGAADALNDATRDQAFEPLSTFTSWFGPRLGMERTGSGLLHGRSVIRYRLGLVAGPSLVEAPNRPGKRLRPMDLTGRLAVDADTGAPLRGRLSGRVDIEPPSPNGEWGRLDLQLEFDLTPTDGAPIVVGEHSPPIARRAVDLDPLGFLKRDTRTSTIIGGQKPAARNP